MTVRPVNWTIRAAPPADAPQVSNCDAPPRAVAQAPQPAQATRRLAELIAVYSACMGQPCTRRDIADTLTTLPPAERAAPQTMLAAGLRAAGFEVRVAPSDLSDAGAWPALARMTDGQFILVLERAGSDLVIYDKTCPDNRATVSLDEFAPVFTGLTIRAEVPLDRLAGTHLTDRPRAHWFWGQFADCRRAMGEVILGSFVANLLAVAVALFALQVYDRVIPHQSEATLWVLAGGALLALTMESLLKIARARLMDGAGRQIEMNVQTLLMNRILGMRSEQAGQAPSQLFSAMREFGSVREFFTASTIGTLADVPFIFVFLLLVASIGGNVVWVLILGGILMVLPGIFLQRKMIRLTQETQGASAKSSRLLHEAIFELDTLKTQRAEDRFRRVWTELTALQALKSSEQRQLASVLTFWSQGIQQVTYIAAVIFGTYLVFAGEFTVGSIIAISILTSRTLAPLTQLAGTMARWGNVKSALEGLDAIVNAPQDSAPERTYLRRERLTGGFELREVKFTYDADMAPVVDIPALVIQPGQKLALLGANGSGKSTLLKLLSGLYAPTSGRLLIDGAEMSQLEPRDLRRLVGYLGQDVRLFTGSLRENLNLTLLESDDDRLLAALDFAGLGPYVKSHPKGLDLEIRDGGQGLSQGQRQSIGWARLWLQDPAICLLDEPTAALDQTLERTLVSRLEGWLEHRTAVIATHRVPILQLTNRTMLLQNGRMAVDGPRDQVLAHLAQRAGAGG